MPLFHFLFLFLRAVWFVLCLRCASCVLLCFSLSCFFSLLSFIWPFFTCFVSAESRAVFFLLFSCSSYLSFSLCESWLFVTPSVVWLLVFDSSHPSAVSTLYLSFLFSTFPLCLSWAIFSLFSFSVCLSVSLLFVIFPFQHSSPCSLVLYFSAFFPSYCLLSISASSCESICPLLRFHVILSQIFLCACASVCACDRGAS